MYGGGGQPGQFQNQIARGPAGYQRGGGRQMNRQQYNQGQQGGQQQVYMRNYSNNFPKVLLINIVVKIRAKTEQIRRWIGSPVSPHSLFFQNISHYVRA